MKRFIRLTSIKNLGDGLNAIYAVESYWGRRVIRRTFANSAIAGKATNFRPQSMPYVVHAFPCHVQF